MVWKILSVIAALAMGGSAYFAYVSKDDISHEKAAKAQAKKKLDEITSRQAEAKKRVEAKTTQVATLGDDLKKTKDEFAKVTAELDEKTKALAAAQAELDDQSKKLADVQKQVEEAGDIERLIANVKALDAEKATAESAVATETQAVAAAEERVTSLQKQIETSREAEARAHKGELEPDFNARIAQAFADWGFAVLNKGNSGGVVANADLNVKRGNDIVAKLKVRNVEPSISVVDIVPGSLAAGEALRAGDLVVAAPVVKKEPPPAPKTDAKAPAGGAPAADGFGGAAPAPAGGAPAAMNADPFGAAPAPAPAPAPAGADPFGAAPAPATPPATGAGTKESPSTADPFK